MAYKTFRREDGPTGVATLLLDGEGPVNTLNRALIADFTQAIGELEQDPKVRAVVLFSAKKDNFIAGADLEMLKAVKTAADGAAISRDGKVLLNRIETSPKPWVAAIHGSCLGGGLEVALACRFRIASEEKATQLGLPETQLGLLPGGGGTQRLPRLIGIQDALDLILAGKSLKPKKALKLGLVDEVVPGSILRQIAEQRALGLAEGTLTPTRGSSAPLSSVRDPKVLAKLALEENPVGRRVLFQQAKKRLLEKTHGNYPAPQKALEAIRAGYEKGAAAGAEAESLGFGELTVSEVAKRLIEIFFAQNALKKDTGVDGDTKPRPVKHVAMLGGGLMGGGIAYVTANAGLPVRIKDKDDAGLQRAFTHVQGLVDERVKRKSLGKQEAVELMSRLTGTTEYAGMAHTDLFIEAVFEDLSLKRRVLADVEAFAKPDAVFASNTSSLPIGQIGAEAKRPENVVGMHYFSPVNKMPLLEVIRAPKTSDQAVATAVALGKKQGKTVIVVNDGPGFYTTRILAPYIGEAGFLLAEGAPIKEIDRALVVYGFPVGPLQLLDEVGIDVASKIAAILEKAFGARMAAPPSFEKLHADGRAGRKNKKGFYTYDGKTKEIDETVYGVVGAKPKSGAVSADEIAERLSLQMINEAVHCLGEGILRSPRDGDIGAVFGLGFPPFRGGPFHAADAIGAKELVAKLRALEAKHGPRFAPAPLLVTHAEKGTKFYG